MMRPLNFNIKLSYLIAPLRWIQGAIAIAVGGLSIYVARWYDAETLTPAPPEFRFLIFAAVCSLLNVVFLEFTRISNSKLANPYLHLAVEFLNTVIFLAGSIALHLFLSQLLFCRGSVCMAAKADVGLAFTSFVLWLLTTTLSAREAVRWRRSRRGIQAPHTSPNTLSINEA